MKVSGDEKTVTEAQSAVCLEREPVWGWMGLEWRAIRGKQDDGAQDFQQGRAQRDVSEAGCAGARRTWGA